MSRTLTMQRIEVHIAASIFIWRSRVRPLMVPEFADKVHGGLITTACTGGGCKNVKAVPQFIEIYLQHSKGNDGVMLVFMNICLVR